MKVIILIINKDNLYKMLLFLLKE